MAGVPSSKPCVVGKPRSYVLGGTKIKFPFALKPYPSQLTCMAKAVTGARLGQNCLLESPTGSGKTMAMLCSLLAWQKQCKEEAEAEFKEAEDKWFEKMRDFEEEPDFEKEAAPIVDVKASPVKEEVISLIDSPPKRPTPKVTKSRMKFMDDWSDEENEKKAQEVIVIPESDDEEDDSSYFKSPKKKHMRTSSDGSSTITSSPALKQVNEPVEIKATPKSSKKPGLPPKPRITKVPKIFFATRTHKQIAQVVRELERTPYRNVNMTILNSREHSCIRNLDPQFSSKTEMCKALMDKNKEKKEEDFNNKLNGCYYKTNLLKFSPDTLAAALNIEEQPWDIEDLVKKSKKINVCPYFGSRDLMAKADIVFCPYNYIIDPHIRKSMNMNLTDNVILFDEAHNIEDAFREANSFKFTTDTLAEAVKSCELGVILGSKKHACITLKESFQTFGRWMEQASSKLRLDGPRARERSCMFGGGQFANEIEVAGFDQKEFDRFSQAAEALMAEVGNQVGPESDDESSEQPPQGNQITDMFKPSPQLVQMVDGLKLIMNRIFSKTLRNRDDYNVVLNETTSRAYQEGPSAGGWMGKADAQAKVQLCLNLWCMNPAIGFADLEDTRSVIVTSGTLTPMTSFQSELGARFPHSLSTDHVISPSQVWVGSVAVGPRGRNINGVYRNAVTIDYQDEVGLSILQICSIVPFGVLCFFPSYAAMDNVMKRWQMSGTWHKLTALKDVIVEPRQMRNFAEAMEDFDYSIRRAEHSGGRGGTTGALLLAVCRGKVSEGIDFKDNHARAVITVSIPYPNVMDLNVKLKKQYNDKNQHRQLLPGNQWYEIQAFRAINQALGRCIRHKNDWGAIILLDDRFSPNTKYSQSISKWAAKNLVHHDYWPDLEESLTEFVRRMTATNGPSGDH